ncbi:hypothetical protein LSH36_469g01030 [Paralvinella palmiformis]|uniref:Uncharacterized protein n=1 Tax=Paralvinella palmiformis TaxID=53620 RepID=A0AAD9MYN6_9ANNE|nr:hypothetical protein LSH36_469g01030 [Paralvinella palmiformis]
MPNIRSDPGYVLRGWVTTFNGLHLLLRIHHIRASYDVSSNRRVPAGGERSSNAADPAAASTSSVTRRS